MMFIRSTLLFASVILLLVISIPASHAEQHQDRVLKKKNKKNSKASKAQKGAASSGKGGKGATTSQPSAAPSETPSETPTSSDPCNAAFGATSCNGVFSCACLVEEISSVFSDCCDEYREGSELCVATLEYVLSNCFARA